MISVLMPVYNGERYLAEAIDSILAQTFNDFEFIIVDDGSTDGSAQIIRDYAQRDERIGFFQLASNQGISSALNRGIREARGEYIALMGHDDVCLPERLQTQFDYMKSHPHIGVLGGSLQLVDQQLTPLQVWNYPQQHALIAYRLLCRGSGFGDPATMMRRKLLIEVGGYQARPGSAEDLDLWVRLASRTRFANLPDVLMLYRRHERAISIEKGAALREEALAIKRAALRQLWHDMPEATLHRLSPLGAKFSWKESLAVKRDLKRLIEKMIASNWIEPADRQMLLEEISRHVQVESPYLYRKLRQWFRYRIRRHLSSS